MRLAIYLNVILIMGPFLNMYFGINSSENFLMFLPVPVIVRNCPPFSDPEDWLTDSISASV